MSKLIISAFGLEEHFYDSTGASNGDKYSFHLNGRPVAQFDGSTYRYILTDALGSVLSMFDTIAGSAQLLGNQLYGPYGNKRYQAGWIGTSKGFTGQREDAATGLDYYNARYYDPVVGRFVSADTVEDNFHRFDPYAYVKGNPETKSDPTGHFGAAAVAGAIHGVGNAHNQPAKRATPSSMVTGHSSPSPPLYETKHTSTGCDDDCGYTDKLLLKEDLNKEKAKKLAGVDAWSDVFALISDFVTLGADATSENPYLIITDLIVVLLRVFALVGDVSKAQGEKLPNVISDIVTYGKQAATTLEFLRGVASWLPNVKFTEWLTKWLGEKVKNAIVKWSSTSLLGIGVTANTTKAGIEDYYRGQLQTIDGLTNEEAHNQCVAANQSHPGRCL